MKDENHTCLRLYSHSSSFTPSAFILILHPSSFVLLDCPHPALTVIFKCLINLLLGIHHEWSIAYDWFIQGHAGNQQNIKCSLSCCVFDSHFLAVLSE